MSNTGDLRCTLWNSYRVVEPNIDLLSSFELADNRLKPDVRLHEIDPIVTRSNLGPQDQAIFHGASGTTITHCLARADNVRRRCRRQHKGP